jgi:hypothetical protein
MVAQRCACVAAWGRDCERVHHLFDDAYVTWPSHRTFRRWGRWRTTWSEEIPIAEIRDLLLDLERLNREAEADEE